GTCAGSGVAEFCIAGWSGIAAAEPAANSKFQPGFFDARSTGDGCLFGGGGIQCAARAEFPGRAAGAREGAARRGVGCIWADDAAELWKLFRDADRRGWISAAPGGTAHAGIQRGGPGLLRDNGYSFGVRPRIHAGGRRKGRSGGRRERNNGREILARQESNWRAG